MMCHSTIPTPSHLEEREPFSARTVDFGASAFDMAPEVPASPRPQSCPQLWTSSDSDECSGVSPKQGVHVDPDTPYLTGAEELASHIPDLALKVEPKSSRPKRVRRGGFYISPDLSQADNLHQRQFLERHFPSANPIPQLTNNLPAPANSPEVLANWLPEDFQWTATEP